MITDQPNQKDIAGADSDHDFGTAFDIKNRDFNESYTKGLPDNSIFEDNKVMKESELFLKILGKISDNKDSDISIEDLIHDSHPSVKTIFDILFGNLTYVKEKDNDPHLIIKPLPSYEKSYSVRKFETTKNDKDEYNKSGKQFVEELKIEDFSAIVVDASFISLKKILKSSLDADEIPTRTIYYVMSSEVVNDPAEKTSCVDVDIMNKRKNTFVDLVSVIEDNPSDRLYKYDENYRENTYNMLYSAYEINLGAMKSINGNKFNSTVNIRHPNIQDKKYNVIVNNKSENSINSLIASIKGAWNKIKKVLLKGQTKDVDLNIFQMNVEFLQKRAGDQLQVLLCGNLHSRIWKRYDNNEEVKINDVWFLTHDRPAASLALYLGLNVLLSTKDSSANPTNYITYAFKVVDPESQTIFDNEYINGVFSNGETLLQTKVDLIDISELYEKKRKLAYGILTDKIQASLKEMEEILKASINYEQEKSITHISKQILQHWYMLSYFNKFYPEKDFLKYVKDIDKFREEYRDLYQVSNEERDVEMLKSYNSKYKQYLNEVDMFIKSFESYGNQLEDGKWVIHEMLTLGGVDEGKKKTQFEFNVENMYGYKILDKWSWRQETFSLRKYSNILSAKNYYQDSCVFLYEINSNKQEFNLRAATVGVFSTIFRNLVKPGDDVKIADKHKFYYIMRTFIINILIVFDILNNDMDENQINDVVSKYYEDIRIDNQPVTLDNEIVTLNDLVVINECEYFFRIVESNNCDDECMFVQSNIDPLIDIGNGIFHVNNFDLQETDLDLDGSYHGNDLETGLDLADLEETYLDLMQGRDTSSGSTDKSVSSLSEILRDTSSGSTDKSVSSLSEITRDTSSGSTDKSVSSVPESGITSQASTPTSTPRTTPAPNTRRRKGSIGTDNSSVLTDRLTDGSTATTGIRRSSRISDKTNQSGGEKTVEEQNKEEEEEIFDTNRGNQGKKQGPAIPVELQKAFAKTWASKHLQQKEEIKRMYLKNIITSRNNVEHILNKKFNFLTESGNFENAFSNEYAMDVYMKILELVTPIEDLEEMNEDVERKFRKEMAEIEEQIMEDTYGNNPYENIEEYKNQMFNINNYLMYFLLLIVSIGGVTYSQNGGSKMIVGGGPNIPIPPSNILPFHVQSFGCHPYFQLYYFLFGLSSMLDNKLYQSLDYIYYVNLFRFIKKLHEVIEDKIIKRLKLNEMSYDKKILSQLKAYIVSHQLKIIFFNINIFIEEDIIRNNFDMSLEEWECIGHVISIIKYYMGGSTYFNTINKKYVNLIIEIPILRKINEDVKVKEIFQNNQEIDKDIFVDEIKELMSTISNNINEDRTIPPFIQGPPKRDTSGISDISGISGSSSSSGSSGSPSDPNIYRQITEPSITRDPSNPVEVLSLKKNRSDSLSTPPDNKKLRVEPTITQEMYHDDDDDDEEEKKINEKIPTRSSTKTVRPKSSTSSESSPLEKKIKLDEKSQLPQPPSSQLPQPPSQIPPSQLPPPPLTFINSTEPSDIEEELLKYTPQSNTVKSTTQKGRSSLSSPLSKLFPFSSLSSRNQMSRSSSRNQTSRPSSRNQTSRSSSRNQGSPFITTGGSRKRKTKRKKNKKCRKTRKN